MFIDMNTLLEEWREYKSYYQYSLYKQKGYSSGTAPLMDYFTWWNLNKDKDAFIPVLKEEDF